MGAETTGGGRASGRATAFALGAAAAAIGAAAGSLAGASAGPTTAAALLRAGGVALAAALLLAAAPPRRRSGRTDLPGWGLLGGAVIVAALPLLPAGLPGAPGAGAPPAFSARPGGGYLLELAGGRRVEVAAPEDSLPLIFPPPSTRGRLRALVVGFPNGRALAGLLARRRTKIVLLEEDLRLLAATARRWPAFEEARRTGRVRVIGGNPRRALERLRGRYDLIVVGAGWSAQARIDGELNRRPDHLLTLEAFRAYLARLDPKGFLLVERSGTARALLTLRAAAGDDARFPEQVAIVGRTDGTRSRLWFRPGGLADALNTRALGRSVRAERLLVFYRPYAKNDWSFYGPLVTGARPAGLAFSTPQDLSPTRDDRPFFDHAGRMRLTPTGALLPDEPHAPGEPRSTRAVPAGDAGLLLILAAGLLLLLLAGASGARAHRAGGGAPIGPGLPVALFAGAGLALALDASAAWAQLAAPTRAAAVGAAAGALAGSGAGWILGSRLHRRAAPLLAAGAVTATAASAAAYPFAIVLFALDRYAAGAAVAALAALATLAVSAGAGAAVAGAGERLPGAGGRMQALAAAAAAVAWTASPLIASSFGFRAHWALAASAAVALLLLRRPPAVPVEGGA